MTVMIETIDRRLVNALTIEERAGEIFSMTEGTWEDWKERKSLLKQTDMDFIFDHYQSEQSFKKGIQPINEQDRDGLLRKVEESDWYKVYQQIIENYEEEQHSDKYDYTYAIRFFLQFMKHFLKEKTAASTQYKFHVDAIVSIVQGYSEELIGIMSRTLAADIQQVKKEAGLTGENGEERFQSYMKHRFGNVESAKNFYHEYPALLRLISTKTLFFMKNIEDFIIRLNENASEIQSTLGQSSTVVQRLGLSAGDSHDQGKSVMLVYFSETELIVYKPKNLVYTKQLDRFFDYLNRNLGTDFYNVRRIVKPTYTFEQFIQRESCTSESEVRSFYRHYGELIGLAYLLRGTDFHYENIIAYGDRPVLIDVETFFQQHVPLEFGESAHVQAKEKQMDSVVLTGLVPFDILADRSDDKKKGINISGLSHGTQKTPFKILKLNHHSTDEMKFEYMDHFISSKSNTPHLHGKEISYEQYQQEIVEGFRSFLTSCMKHKEVFAAELEEVFQAARVRNVVRPTQRYVDLLQFSYHPHCMKNMIEREKVLHNLFAYPYRDKRIAGHELNEMLEGDIPQFFNEISDAHLYNSQNEMISNVYKRTMISEVVQSITNLSDKQIEEQCLQIELSMGTFMHTASIPEQSKENVAISQESVLDVVKEVSQSLLDEAIYDEKTESMTWIDLVCKDTWKYEAMNNQLYDGLPGMYAFFAALQATDPSNTAEYTTIKRKILNTMLVIPSAPKASMFYGNGALIYPLLIDFKLNGNEEALKLASQLADQIMIFDYEDTNDWLVGKPSLIVVFHQLSLLTNNAKYEAYAQKLSDSLTYDEQTPFVGLIHGNSGAYYAKAMMGLAESSIDTWITREDEHWQGSYWNDPRPEKTGMTHAVCHGSTGILLSRWLTECYTNSDKEVQQKVEAIDTLFNDKREDSVCHGTSGDIELLLALQQKGNDTDALLESKVKQLVSNYRAYGQFRLQGYQTIQSKGLYTGITGVLYTLLRTINRDIPSFVLLQAMTEEVE